MTDVAGYLRKMADDERRVDYGRALQQSAAARNFGNIGHNLYAIANNMLRAGYKGALQHFTGQIPLTGERDAQGARGALDAVGAAGLAAGPLAGRALAQVAATPKPARGITAYHGSPHDFDKFQMSQIGTGEGAQAYGHGLYFAEQPEVAQMYRQVVTEQRSDLPRLIAQEKRARDRVLKENPAADVRDYDRRIVEMDRQLDDEVRKGRLYEVNIKANKEDFLDWDRPLNEQSESLRGLLESAKGKVSGRAIEDLEDVLRIKDQPLGVVAGQTRLFRPEITQRFKDAGIPGIKYLDQGSRGSGSGTYNYVVFDEDLIEITKKMGIAVPIPGVPGVVVSEEDFNALQGVQDGSVR